MMAVWLLKLFYFFQLYTVWILVAALQNLAISERRRDATEIQLRFG